MIQKLTRVILWLKNHSSFLLTVVVRLVIGYDKDSKPDSVDEGTQKGNEQ